MKTRSTSAGSSSSRSSTPGVAHQLNLVPLLLTPDPDHLGHDAGQVGVHHPAVQRRIGAFGNKIQNADLKSAHGQSSYGTAFSLGCPGHVGARTERKDRKKEQQREHDRQF